MNQLEQHIAKGTIVTIRTTNGGKCTVKLLEDCRAIYGVHVQRECYAAGMQFFMPSWRITSIEIVNNYWTAPMSATEAEDILERVIYARRNLRRRAA